MGKYSSEWASALEDVADAGSAVTWTRTIQTNDPETDTLTPTVTTISGYAIRVKGDPDTYARLGLVEQSAPTLFFVPSTYGSLPKAGDIVTWNSLSYTAMDVNPLAPDGTTIAARIMVGL